MGFRIQYRIKPRSDRSTGRLGAEFQFLVHSLDSVLGRDVPVVAGSVVPQDFPSDSNTTILEFDSGFSHSQDCGFASYQTRWQRLTQVVRFIRIPVVVNFCLHTWLPTGYHRLHQRTENSRLSSVNCFKGSFVRPLVRPAVGSQQTVMWCMKMKLPGTRQKNV